MYIIIGILIVTILLKIFFKIFLNKTNNDLMIIWGSGGHTA